MDADTLDRWLTLLAALAWCLPFILLLLPFWRLFRKRARPLDALWSVLLLGVANRIWSDFGHSPAWITHLSAILMATVLAVAIRSYQNADV